MIKDIGYLEILKTNPGSSIQDQGRNGLGQWGIPISGAMDRRSYDWLNYLLQNKPDAAMLEILQPGFKCKFDSYTTLGLAGAQVEIKKNGTSITSCLIHIMPGDELEIGRFNYGSILYLGIAEGFQTEKVLSSRSFYPKITEASMLSKGEKIPFFTNQSKGSETYSSVKIKRDWMEGNSLTAYSGPNFDSLTLENQNTLLESNFTISTLANRMAFQLTELLPNAIPEQMTAAVYPGTIQLTSGGKLIILMQDTQTTGGYPRILQLSQESLSLLAQKKPGDQIRFHIKNTSIL